MLSLVRLFGEVLLLSLVIVVLLYVFEFILQRILEKRNLKIGDEIRVLLEKVLNSELSDYERAFAASELGRQTMNDSERQVVSRVLRLVLRNKHLPEAVRASSAGALGEIDRKRNKRIFKLIARNKDENEYVRMPSIINLGLLETSLKTIQNITKDNSEKEKIRLLSITVIVRYSNRIQNAEFLKKNLIENINTPQSVRTHASKMIQILKNPEGIERSNEEIVEFLKIEIIEDQNLSEGIKFFARAVIHLFDTNRNLLLDYD